MKYHALLPLAVTLSLLTGAPLAARAQTGGLPPTQPPVFTPDNGRTTPPATRSYFGAAPTANEAPSITSLLRLDTTVVLRLDRAYVSYARTRLQQEAQIENAQNALRTAHAATTFDERKASQLSGGISESERRIADAYLKARGESLQTLTAVQRVRLERLEASDPPIRDDKYRFLLLSQIEDLWRTPIDAEVGQYLLNASVNAPQSYTQNYYVVPPTVYPSYPSYPVYSTSPAYSYDTYVFNSYDYGYQHPFYSHSHDDHDDRDGNRNNDRDRYHSSPRDRDARPLWNRDNSVQRPALTPSAPPETHRPLYRPQSPDTTPGKVFDVPRPTEGRRDNSSGPRWDPPQPQRPEPQRPEPQRPEPQRPEPQRPEPPRPESPRPEPPRSEPKQPEQPKQPEHKDNDASPHWNRGGGGRGR